MKRIARGFWKNYYLEFLFTAIFLCCFIIVFEWLFRTYSNPVRDEKFGILATGISVTSAGFTFLLGQIYSRLKERREVKRKRAVDLFIEWHSPEIRESRKYVSPWRKFRIIDCNERWPALSVVENNSNIEYRKKRENSLDVSKGPTQDELFDAEKMEHHFFAIYQFFERWFLYTRNGDIDKSDANSYMYSYKDWYISEFISQWEAAERNLGNSSDPKTNKYILNSLQEIMKNL